MAKRMRFIIAEAEALTLLKAIENNPLPLSLRKVVKVDSNIGVEKVLPFRYTFRKSSKKKLTKYRSILKSGK